MMGVMLALFLFLSGSPVWGLNFIEDSGARVDVERHLEDGKVGIVFFHAPWSKTSSRYRAELENWAKGRTDVIVLGVTVPSMTAPVAKQYGLKQVPAFFVYDKEKVRTHSGGQALDEVLRMMKEGP